MNGQNSRIEGSGDKVESVEPRLILLIGAERGNVSSEV